MNNLIFPIILQILGVAIILAEFVIPSAGLLTVSALGSFGYSIFLISQNFSSKITLIFVTVDIMLIPVLVWLGVKIISMSPLALKESLSKESGSVAQDLALSELINQEGVALSTLRPSGKALINEKRYDVVSTGDYIEKSEKIYVTAVDGNRIVVKKKL